MRLYCLISNTMVFLPRQFSQRNRMNSTEVKFIVWSQARRPKTDSITYFFIPHIHQLSKSKSNRMGIHQKYGRHLNAFQHHHKWRATRYSRKEVIQPQVPLRLPCYDFAPVTKLTLDGCLLANKVSSPASGPPSFHRVTGGVYKARERIHRGVADPRLLAIPTSWRRIAASNPNWGRFLRFAPPRGIASFCTGHCSTCAALGIKAMRT